MKKKMSLSLLLLSIVTILTFKNLTGIMSGWYGFSLRGILTFAASTIWALAPIALVVLLVLNAKRDMKKVAFIMLLVFGCSRLISSLFSISAFTYYLSAEIYLSIPYFVTWLVNILIGCILIMSALCIQKQQKNNHIKIIAWIGFGLSMIPLGVYLFRFAHLDVTTFINVFLLLPGLCLLPVTIFDYENCVKLNTAPGATIVILVAATSVVMSLTKTPSYSGSSSSGSSSSGSSYSGSSGSYGGSSSGSSYGGSSYGGSSSGGRTCAKSGCSNKAVTSGDSVYCASHSNRCGNCGCYIDGDAMFCMDCIIEALGQ